MREEERMVESKGSDVKMREWRGKKRKMSKVK